MDYLACRRRLAKAQCLISFVVLAGLTVPRAARAQVDAGSPPLPFLTGMDASTPPAPEVVDVTVHGARDEGKRLQRSAEAVTVVDLRRARVEAADLGEVLARTQGISIRREGGLGSNARFSLNGLEEAQIRFFLDGVPLDMAGFPYGVANVPVNLVQRVEVYRGVVPIRFGADALGGAVNLVSDPSYDRHAGVSYQIGSFGQHRLTANGRYRHEPTGLVAGVTAFFDDGKNDYPIDVKNPDMLGRLVPVHVKRFHDAYRAFGTTLELGIVERPWAKRLLVTGTVTGLDRELQHNIVMTTPYGEVRQGEQVFGTTARYEVDLPHDVSLELLASYAHRIIDFEDKAAWVYDWFGKRINPRTVPGEIDAKATDQTNWQSSVFGRALVQWKPSPTHQLRLSTSPYFATRTGDERLQSDPRARDPLTAERRLRKFVTGLEYELNLFDQRVQNIAFVKDYVFRADAEDPLSGAIFIKKHMDHHSFGVGDALRIRIGSHVYLKASYEYATRLPDTNEVFGDAVRIRANLDLKPEVSHNVNLGPRLELRKPQLGSLTVDLNLFLRDTERQIVLLGNDQTQVNQNVYRARGFGSEHAVAWTSRARWVSLDAALTWQSVRNASSKGAFGAFEGDRIPNRPWLFGSWGARLRYGGLPDDEDALEPYYHGRYVHEFYRGWESAGLKQYKDTIDKQITHNVGLTYTFVRDRVRAFATFEVANVSDAKAYDNFGVQRPGRGYYFKIAGDL